MKDKDIIEAWATIRKIDNSIPDDVLDFMKDAAIERLKEPQPSSDQIAGMRKDMDMALKREKILRDALEFMIKDIKSKPNDTRYTTAIKKATDALASYNQSPSTGGEQEYVTQEQYKEMAEKLDKPVLNMLKQSGVAFDKWGPNIHRLIEKELGIEKVIVYKRKLNNTQSTQQ